MKQTGRKMIFVLAAAIMLCILPKVSVKADETGWAGPVWWYYNESANTLYIGHASDPKADMDDYEDESNAPWAAKSWYGSVKTITIRTNVKSIGERAFANSDVEEVKFEDNSVCTEIGAFAFENCTSLKKVTFGSNPKITLIDKYAFTDCDSLESISLPSSLKKLGAGAFQTSGLKSVTVPRYCTSLGTSVFSLCPKLTKISVNSKNKSLSSKNGVLFNKKKSKLIQYPSKKKGTTYTVPSSVTKVKTLKMSKKIKTISEGAFDFTDIKKIYFPRNRPTIKGGKMFDSDMVVTIYYKKARWPKKYRKNYGAQKVNWKKY